MRIKIGFRNMITRRKFDRYVPVGRHGNVHRTITEEAEKCKEYLRNRLDAQGKTDAPVHIKLLDWCEVPDRVQQRTRRVQTRVRF